MATSTSGGKPDSLKTFKRRKDAAAAAAAATATNGSRKHDDDDEETPDLKQQTSNINNNNNNSKNNKKNSIVLVLPSTSQQPNGGIRDPKLKQRKKTDEEEGKEKKKKKKKRKENGEAERKRKGKGEEEEEDGEEKEKEKKKREDVSEKHESAIATSFPLNRIDRIVRSEGSDYRLTSEAVFLIKTAAEKFLEAFCEDSYASAVQDRKKSLGYKHLSTIVSKERRFDFLSDFVPEKVKAEKALAEIKPGGSLPA